MTTKSMIIQTLSHVSNMKDLEFQGYHKFRRGDGSEYGSFEVFYQSEHCITNEGLCDPGWYWWACFPGCLPESEQHGPFPSAEGAYLDAIDGFKPENLLGLPVEDPEGFEDDLNDGEYEQSEAYLERLAADISPEEARQDYIDTAYEEGTRYERAFGDGNDLGG